jgi:BirA family biotin operon repressor/biotin-[acetyl-CoA-carboxylase] ligase
VTDAQFISRQERFRLTGSTNDIVARWLADGTPEVCLALADEQSSGRGRQGRTWSAPPDRALLLSVGFRPSWLEPHHAWRLAADVALAMADAAEEVAGIRDGTIRLKWPNDLVVEADDGGILKLGGVLGETDGLGGEDPRVVVGIGINADWPAGEFPPELAGAMTSLREVSHGRPIDRAMLLDGFLSRLEPRILALREAKFAVGDWIDRQVTTGRIVEIEGVRDDTFAVLAVGVNPDTGALLVEDPAREGEELAILSGDVRHARLAGTPEAAVGALAEPGDGTFARRGV